MGAPRRWAAGLLRAAIRLAPEHSRAWAIAMLRELDFIEGDWAAFFWALGSLAAILRHAASAWRAWFNRTNDKEARMTNTGKKILLVAMGALSALALAGCAFPMTRLIPNLFPGLRDAGWAHILAAVGIPEVIIIIAAALLWRKRGPVAAGVMLTGLAIAFHLAVHLTMHH
jgi:hypothetical protein